LVDEKLKLRTVIEGTYHLANSAGASLAKENNYELAELDLKRIQEPVERISRKIRDDWNELTRTIDKKRLDANSRG
jgi:hypothetical protein